MKFEEVSFSKRYPPILCNIVTIHEKWAFRNTHSLMIRISRRGTAVGIILPNGAMFVGVALCSESDQFSNAVGRHTALGRAVQAVYRETVPMSRHYAIDKDGKRAVCEKFNQPIQPSGWVLNGPEATSIIEILQREINEARERSIDGYFKFH